jgi:hypothetical protein
LAWLAPWGHGMRQTLSGLQGDLQPIVKSLTRISRAPWKRGSTAGESPARELVRSTR